MLKAGNHTAGFGELIAAAVKLDPVENPVLKNASDFKLIGKENLPRKDSYTKTNGTALFSMDVKEPSMVYTTILRSPKFGSKLKSFDASLPKQLHWNRFLKAWLGFWFSILSCC